MQREVDVFQIPADVVPKAVTQDIEGIKILWTDSHNSHHPWAWIESALNARYPDRTKEFFDKKVLWDASIASSPPEIRYDEVMADSGLAGMAKLTKCIKSHGFCFVTNTPVTPEATQQLLERIGPIRHTHYGGFYDFVPDMALADTAYSNQALAAHTDTTYFTEPAGLQAFHMLSHTPPPNSPPSVHNLGGRSLLVDGFNVARKLQGLSNSWFRTLARTKVPWHASGNLDVAITPDMAYPVIEMSPVNIKRIRWNNDDRGALPPTPTTLEWYEAARAWKSLLQHKDNEYWFQLEPGRVLIFDNWRVLHGRSAFEGLRRICGAYSEFLNPSGPIPCSGWREKLTNMCPLVGRDDFISRWRVSNFPRDEVILGNMRGPWFDSYATGKSKPSKTSAKEPSEH
ncbi:hypothetical protein S7711_01468 [Stachybotrys chartarum IBT 7711]|uniref:TauD/TfdA-like domain-containing protein n=1 Tax=Stachybotrys chartarum (strain CBS 109288 / IBT 7711) TaxID=1280523 RepID=A0A084B725_STACB|nr:hypothetical protein S7711_01468 [Stachybotrys chartarum IBT 7711]KFA55100.1 hypothetical protein S40293_03511 [Stachybotrys chartarum IBT 40293]